MKRLIAVTTLALALSFSSLSFALDYMNLYYTKPIAKSEVRNEIKGGEVEADFTSFYLNPHAGNKTNSLTFGQGADEQYVSVFGVRIVK